MLTSVKIFFCLFKTRFLNLVQIVRIVIRVQIFWCFIICGTYFFFKYNFIRCIVNDGVVLLLSVNFFTGCGSVHMVLSRPTLSILSSKVPQNLIFSWRMSGAVDETGFWFSCRAIYIPLSEIFSALNLLREIP